MPARGSIQDRVVSELLVRERRQQVVKQVYLGRILAAGLQLPEALFKLWTSLLSMEVSQENYAAVTTETKKDILKALAIGEVETRQKRVQMFEKIDKLTVRDDDRKATPEEVENFMRRRRRMYLTPKR